MSDWLFANGLAWYTIPAIVGSVFFVLRLGLMLAGGVADTDLIPDIDADADIDPDLHDSTEAFKLLSLQAIAAFLMGFGWGSFAAIRSGMTDSYTAATFIGVLIGAAMVWLLAWMMKLIYDLQTSGNISISSAVGLEGVVYAQVPAGGKGTGQVKLVINERQRIFNARTEGDAISSSSHVRITGVTGNTLIVTPA
jgi:membrane protein implicated in regulation of membrane protease activity